ncbi:MAG TPA: Gfo/Idh/MocA family oxidoreductase, partial [Anaerolineaceae bacterium]|nr:Gfo/Idh/MocA family oxidoreductase [Anaerolineaceae bacterium]
IERAPEAYELITGKTGQPFLGVLLTYSQDAAELPSHRVTFAPGAAAPLNGEPGVGVLGAGNYAMAVFLPAVQAVGGARRVAIASATGLSARNAAQRFGFGYASSQEIEVLDDPAVNVVAVLTRHDQHARQVLACLERGKHVFCEKPLAIRPADLDAIEQALTQDGHPLLMVGYNRRFAPLAQRLHAFLQGADEPLYMHYRVNAGYIPANHWVHDPQVGGGRIFGEACHFVDFLTFLAGAAPVSVTSQALPDVGRYRGDNLSMTFAFPDGSVGVVDYLANGDKSFPKERVEVFCAGRVGVLDDFRSLQLVRDGHRQTFSSLLRQDKGHRAGWSAFLSAVRSGGPAPIKYEEMIGGMRMVMKGGE